MGGAFLTITKDGKMHWDEKRERFGTRAERHSLGRFVIRQACHLPVTVRVRKSSTKRSFSFQPALVDDVEKKVILTHKKYRIAMDFDDIVQWIRIFIMSNKMYEQDLFKFYS
jgi:hypothetical protein